MNVREHGEFCTRALPSLGEVGIAVRCRRQTGRGRKASVPDGWPGTPTHTPGPEREGSLLTSSGRTWRRHIANQQGACTAVALAAPVRGPWDPSNLVPGFPLARRSTENHEEDTASKVPSFEFATGFEFKCGGGGGGPNHVNFVAARVHFPVSDWSRPVTAGLTEASQAMWPLRVWGHHKLQFPMNIKGLQLCFATKTLMSAKRKERDPVMTRSPAF